MKKVKKYFAVIIVALMLASMALPAAASAEDASESVCVERSFIVNGLAAAIDPMSAEDSYSKNCYLVEDGVMEDGTVVSHLSEVAPHSGYMLGMILNIQKVSNNIYSIEVQAYAEVTGVLIKSFSAVIDYGNGDREIGYGVNQPPTIDGCSKWSIINYHNRVYSAGTYYVDVVSYRLIICEYIDTDNTEEADLNTYGEYLVVG